MNLKKYMGPCFITVRAEGTIYLNSKTREHLNNAGEVDLYHDTESNLIGVIASDVDGYKVSKKTHTISPMRTFMTFASEGRYILQEIIATGMLVFRWEGADEPRDN